MRSTSTSKDVDMLRQMITFALFLSREIRKILLFNLHLGKFYCGEEYKVGIKYRVLIKI